MEHRAIDDVQNWLSPASAKRPVGRALDADTVALNYYELDPGETFGFGYHRHPEQEELFVILAGEATFETESGEVTVGADEAIRFAPGEWQLGRNDGDAVVRALAIGAPADASDADIRRNCPDCGERTPHEIEPRDDGDALVTVCRDCGAGTGRYH